MRFKSVCASINLNLNGNGQSKFYCCVPQLLLAFNSILTKENYTLLIQRCLGTWAFQRKFRHFLERFFFQLLFNWERKNKEKLKRFPLFFLLCSTVNSLLHHSFALMQKNDFCFVAATAAAACIFMLYKAVHTKGIQETIRQLHYLDSRVGRRAGEHRDESSRTRNENKFSIQFSFPLVRWQLYEFTSNMA